MDIKQTLDNKISALNAINLKIDELDADRIRLREEGLFLMGSIDILSTQVRLEEHEKEQQEQTELNELPN